MHRFEEDPVVPALGAPPGAAGPEYLQHRRPILICHPRQHGRLLPNRPAKCHRSTNVGIHSPHTQPNPSTRPSLHLSAPEFVSRAAARLSLHPPQGLTDPDFVPRHDDDDPAVMAAIAAMRSIRTSAVLVPIIARREPTVLLTERTSHLRDHSGQVCFPGGKIDDVDE